MHFLSSLHPNMPSLLDPITLLGNVALSVSSFPNRFRKSFIPVLCSGVMSSVLITMLMASMSVFTAVRSTPNFFDRHPLQ